MIAYFDDYVFSKGIQCIDRYPEESGELFAIRCCNFIEGCYEGSVGSILIESKEAGKSIFWSHIYSVGVNIYLNEHGIFLYYENHNPQGRCSITWNEIKSVSVNQIVPLNAKEYYIGDIVPCEVLIRRVGSKLRFNEQLVEDCIKEANELCGCHIELCHGQQCSQARLDEKEGRII